VVFFVHAVEESDGRWTCQRGRQRLDPSMGHHPHVDDALAHLREVAQTLEGAIQIVLHFADGTAHALEVEG
jgi:hypothetical protein